MKKKMLLCLLLVVCLLPLNATAGLYWGTVVRITSKSAVNVRVEPETKAKMVGEAMSTNTYTLLENLGDWYYIQFTHDLRGYVPAKYSQLEDGLVWYEWLPGEVEAVVRNTHYNDLNVRTKPDKDSSVVGSIKPDTTWPYCGTENGWNRILYDGEYAFVAANRTTIEVVDSVTGATASTRNTTAASGSSLLDRFKAATGQGSTCSECTGGVCSACDGTGKIYSRKAGKQIVCPSCEGEKTCWACGGDGVQ